MSDQDDEEEASAPLINQNIPRRTRKRNEDEFGLEMQNYAGGEPSDRRIDEPSGNENQNNRTNNNTEDTSSNAVFRASNPGVLNIDTDDMVEDQKFLKSIYNNEHGMIEDEELQVFIQRYLYDKVGTSRAYNLEILEDIFQSGSLVADTLYVEDPITGAFSAVSATTSQLRQRFFRQKTKQNFNEENRQLESIDKIDNHPFENREIQLGSKVLYAPPVAPTLLPDEIQLRDSAQREEWVMVTMEYRNFAFVKRLIFLFFQGLYAGFALTTVFAHDAADGSDKKFLEQYQPVAQNTRRFLFVLSALVVVGSIDCAWTLSSQSYRSKHYFPQSWPEQSLPTQVSQQYKEMQKVTLMIGIVISILSFISFLAVLIMSPFDVMVAIENGYSEGSSDSTTDDEATTSEWITYALDDAIFIESYSSWMAGNKLRFATAVLAWVGTVGLLFVDISRFTKLWLHIRSMRQTALSWMKRARMLEGHPDELQSLNPSQLREAISLLESGLQKARTALTTAMEEEEQHNVAVQAAAARRRNRLQSISQPSYA